MEVIYRCITTNNNNKNEIIDYEKNENGIYISETRYTLIKYLTKFFNQIMKCFR